jgi:DNA ligase-associated metallophosphoesterase
MTEVEVAGQTLALLPGKAVWWAARRTLFVADLHVGKAVSFRRLGVPVPQGTTSQTLAALDALLVQTGATRLVCLGDFLHGPQAHAVATLAAVQRWRERHAALHVVLVRGNHDDRAGDPPAALCIDVVDEPFVDGPFAGCHHPVPRAEGYVLAGHLHPSVRLAGRGRDRLRLPCFWFGPRVGVLPAFGAFTGTHAIAPAPGDRVFAVADDRVFSVV